MRYLIQVVLLLGCLSYAWPAEAQLQCQVVVGTPEDVLMLAVNGADNPQDQVAALDKYAQAHADSAFMPCANSYYAAAYLKLNNFDKAIEYGEKDIVANSFDLNLMVNLMRAYVGSGKATDTAFDVIDKVSAQIKVESNPPRLTTESEADWQKAKDELTAQLKDQRAYAEYAFFQLLPRVAEPKKRVQYLDAFMQAYPDTSNVNQVNFQYFLAYQTANDAAKTAEYGEKAIASDPNNVATLNLVADDYASRQANLDKASDYAKKVVDLAPKMQKPEGMTDEQFKANQDAQLGLAHFTLGYVALQKTGKTHRVAPAIQELKSAVDLLGSNPQLQARALFYLGYAYENLAPAKHQEASDAFARSAGIPSPWQAEAQKNLAKVKSALGH
jgi:tetratricopeptide (TPR) repeat protein